MSGLAYLESHALGIWGPCESYLYSINFWPVVLDENENKESKMCPTHQCQKDKKLVRRYDVFPDIWIPISAGLGYRSCSLRYPLSHVFLQQCEWAVGKTHRALACLLPYRLITIVASGSWTHSCGICSPNLVAMSNFPRTMYWIFNVLNNQTPLHF